MQKPICFVFQKQLFGQGGATGFFHTLIAGGTRGQGVPGAGRGCGTTAPPARGQAANPLGGEGGELSAWGTAPGREPRKRAGLKYFASDVGLWCSSSGELSAEGRGGGDASMFQLVSHQQLTRRLLGSPVSGTTEAIRCNAMKGMHMPPTQRAPEQQGGTSSNDPMGA